MKVNKLDIAIRVTPKGASEILIPKDLEQELTYQQLMNMLQEIRKLELAFTEIVNQTFVPETDDEKEIFGEELLGEKE